MKKKICLFLISTFLFIGLTEILLEFKNIDMEGNNLFKIFDLKTEQPLNNDDIYKSEDKYCYQLNSNLNFYFYINNIKCIYKTNESGYVLEEKSKNKENIIFIGDSIGIGHGVEEKKRFYNLLKTQSNNYNFINLSCPGYNTYHYYYSIKNNIKKYNPKFIYLLFNIENDFDIFYSMTKYDKTQKYYKNYSAADLNIKFKNPIELDYNRQDIFSSLIIQKQDTLVVKKLKQIVNFLFLNSYLRKSNILKIIKNNLLIRDRNKHSFYNMKKYTEDDFLGKEIALYYLNEIKKICANNRIDLRIILIPLTTFKLRKEIGNDIYRQTKNILTKNNFVLLEFNVSLKNKNYNCSPFDSHPNYTFHKYFFDLINRDLNEKK